MTKQLWNDVIVPVLVIIGAITIFIVIAIFLFTDKGLGKSVDSPTFDHSQCQYPNRLSNPPDGCDNSDPARPECMKIGTEDCSLPLKDDTQPISAPKTSPAPSELPKTSSCSDNAYENR